MMNQEFYDKLAGIVSKEAILENEPMSKHTSFHIGGSVEIMAFPKNPEELSEMFMQTEAYSVLFMEMVTDNKKASDFVNGILPKDLVEQAEKMEKQGAVTPTLLN